MKLCIVFNYKDICLAIFSNILTCFWRICGINTHSKSPEVIRNELNVNNEQEYCNNNDIVLLSKCWPFFFSSNLCLLRDSLSVQNRLKTWLAWIRTQHLNQGFLFFSVWVLEWIPQVKVYTKSTILSSIDTTVKRFLILPDHQQQIFWPKRLTAVNLSNQDHQKLNYINA